MIIKLNAAQKLPAVCAGLKCVYTTQPAIQLSGRNVLNIHSMIKRATSSTVHTAALLWRSDVINVLAGQLKRRLAGLIRIVHATGCVQRVVKYKHRVTCQSVIMPYTQRKHKDAWKTQILLEFRAS